MKLRFLYLLVCFCLCGKCSIYAQIEQVYLIPGQGSDGRLFKNLKLDKTKVEIIEFVNAEKDDDMKAYAERMAKKIDTSRPFAIVGVSLGGMLAIEINKLHPAEKVVLIASAKHREEIPRLYRFFDKVSVHKLMGGGFLKFWIRSLQPLFEPMPKEDQLLWRDMLKQKDPLFMKCALDCIIGWELNIDEVPSNLSHIHGTKDKTLPIKHIEDAIVVQGGSHVMTLTHAEEISEILNELLK